MNRDYLLSQPLNHSRAKDKMKLRLAGGSSARRGTWQDQSGFVCRQCSGYVVAERAIAGVRNRNHCPYCLWSRCLDLFQPGDRLSACKAPMQPVGLALKRRRQKYGPAAGGELMLVHVCSECRRISANRIAADDDPQQIYWLYEKSLLMSRTEIDSICAGGVQLLDSSFENVVRFQLFGKSPYSSGLFSTLSVKEGTLAR
jgi:hypothetical protein